MQKLEKHSIVHDLPEYHDIITHLKSHDGHFEHLSKQYDQLSAELFKLEENNSPVADEYIESLKLQRVQLKDQLFNLIKQSEQKS